MERFRPSTGSASEFKQLAYNPLRPADTTPNALPLPSPNADAKASVFGEGDQRSGGGGLRLEIPRDDDARAAVVVDLQPARALKMDAAVGRDIGPQGVVHGSPIAHRLGRVGGVRAVGGLVDQRDEIGRERIAPFQRGHVEPQVGALALRHAGHGRHRFNDQVLAGGDVVGLRIGAERAHHGVAGREGTRRGRL